MANIVITKTNLSVIIEYNDLSSEFKEDQSILSLSSLTLQKGFDNSELIEVYLDNFVLISLKPHQVDTIDGVTITTINDLKTEFAKLFNPITSLNVSGVDAQLLAQVQPNTSVQTLYTPSVGKKGVLTHLWIAVYDSDVRLTLNHDDGGTTYSKSNAWMDNLKVKKDSVIISLPLGNIRVSNGGSIGIKIDKNQDATFSLYGYEEDI